MTEKNDENLAGSSSTFTDHAEPPVFPEIVKKLPSHSMSPKPDKSEGKDESAPKKIRKKMPESKWNALMAKIWSSSSEG